jgi:glycosyltransferase involved in cell wall biosynthesis
MNGATDIVIGIPTYRRPELLQALLDSLLPEIQGRQVRVIVADNDCGSDAPRVVELFRRQWPDSVCIPVAARGVAQVRNALVAQALETVPGWRWLVMMDDDGLVTSGWLGHLLATGEKFGSHLVGGPVDGVLPAGASVFAQNSIFAARRRWTTGLVPTLNTTQNLAISRSVEQLFAPPFFRNEYGASGGEDYDFFRRVAQAGGKIAWCDEAVVLEPAPAERLTTRSLLHRYATTGGYMVAIDSHYDGRGATAIRAFKGAAGAMVRMAVAALTMEKVKLAREVLTLAHYSGRIAGLMGMRTSRYVATVKPKT